MPQMINYGGELIRISSKDSKKLEYSKNNGLSWNQRCAGSSSYGKFIDLMEPQFGISKACFCLKIVSIKAQKEDYFSYICY